jgi:hypothetical protein
MRGSWCIKKPLQSDPAGEESGQSPRTSPCDPALPPEIVGPGFPFARVDGPADCVCQNACVNSPGRTALLSALLVLAVIASACGSAINSPSASLPASPSASRSAAGSPNQADRAVYAAIEGQVQAIRQLQPKTTVAPVLLDSNGVRDWLTKANNEQTNHQALADESRLFVHLGLIPAGSSLEQMELDLQAGQVIGFYDPVSKGLYVLSESGGVGPAEKLTFSHEYTHALQDQNFGLDKLAIDTPDQGDRDLARIALPEGDATLEMTLWMARNLSPVEMLIIAGGSLNGPQVSQLAKAPAILRQTLLFPYDAGLTFVEGIYSKGGWAAVDKAYANPPASTSQILHPQLYTDGVAPAAVAVPAVPAALASGWRLTMQDTLGELQLRIWLEGESPDSALTTAAAAATSDWGGDRVGLYEGPNGAWAVVLRTVWRNPGGESDFQSAAVARIGSSTSLVCGSGSGVDVFLASDDAALRAFAPCASAT